MIEQMRDEDTPSNPHTSSIQSAGESSGPGADVETARGPASTDRDGADMRNVILRYIRDHSVLVGPTMDDIATGVGLGNRSSVFHHIRRLEAEGKIRRVGRKGYGPA